METIHTLQSLFDVGLYIASLILIVGLKQLSTPKTARLGNLLASVGIGLGILIMLFYPLDRDYNNYLYIVSALVIGGTIGLIVANRVAMTAMPEMVSLFNGYGGLCALLVSGVWLLLYSGGNGSQLPDGSTIALINIVLGSMATTGSYIAYLKLKGKIKKWTIPRNALVNSFFLLLIVCVVSWSVHEGTFSPYTLAVLLALGLLYGVTFVVPIGGADMPVVISFLNSITGVTAAVGGVITSNTFMLLGGILVGASGSILTLLMCKAMNRSLYNVLVGSFSKKSSQIQEDSAEQHITQTTVSDLSVVMAYANKVAIVPGYGMAVAQAQKACKEIESIIVGKGIEFRYAIHPVAGRMPGHMNVLLAEADVPYDYLMDLEESNAYLKSVDVVLVVGANDVVNPAALEDPSSSIYGMPIINLSSAASVVVIKRSMSTGYAGIPNMLFSKKNTNMLFGDAKLVLQELAQELRAI